MRTSTIVSCFLGCLIFCGLPVCVSADVIDSFTVSQGPITVGPGEEPGEEEILVYTPSVLGGIRVAGPVVDAESQSGSTATLEVMGGYLECAVDFPSLNNDLNNGGCAVGYDRDAGPVFDLTGSIRFLIDVQSVEGSMSLGVLLVDANAEASVGLIEEATPGQHSINLNELFPVTSLSGADLALIEFISLVIINQEGGEGRVVVSEFATAGPIKAGPVLPVDDEISGREIPGTYFNPDRDGEGCQLTLERDQITFILTCYFYRDGEQFWVIGVGELVGGQISFGELTVTSGAQYGNAFDPDDVVRDRWGSALMIWSDCNNAQLQLTPVLAGYDQIALDLTRIVPTTCGGGGVQGSSLPWMGAYFDANRDGEGFHFGVESGEVFVMTWYTYLNGRQVWVIGTGVRDGMRVVFDNMVITSGTGFGSEFDAGQVVRETFGAIIVDFTDCNNFTATINPAKQEFHNLVLHVTKIVPGACQ